MATKMLIDATHAEETRVVVVDGNKVEEFDFESENRRQLAGNIYLAKVTRVEPSLQAAFIDYGGNRHGFLAFSEIHPDYYQIPTADREALMEEERAYAEAQEAEEEERAKPKSRSRGGRGRSRAASTSQDDAVTSIEVSGMETIDLDEDLDDDEGSSPMERVAETPVEEPDDDGAGPGDAGDEDASKNRRTRNRRSRSRNDDAEGDEADDGPDAADKDDDIETVADEDTHEDIRPPRKPRARKYKIQEVVKVRQILLVQVVKEERGNKGAALTTYLSLAGRYCVLMPNTARGGGISRKITNAPDRKKLKEIANEIDVPKGAGLIVRTAGAKRTKPEIKRDYEYLQRMWEQIRELTLKSIAPVKIYEEGDLIKRSIRDLYNRDIDEVLVEGERGYRIAKDFMKMIMPSHAKNVKNYVDTMPLFARFQVETYLNSMFNPTVQLKSGGYIVIGVTEALVAIDVNSGRATKEGSIEDTATKTNLEAAEEVARQLRLRDLAGLIVIDFIDMDERKNNAAVEKRMKDKLKTDRARIQVSRISGFGLMEMSRQRLRPGMIEATTRPCHACHGTGLIRSDDNLALNILRQIEEEGTKGRSLEVLVRAPVGIANFLMNQKREHIAQIEVRYGLSVRIEGDPSLVSPDFALEKFKTATRTVPEQIMRVVSVDSSLMDDIDSETETDPDELPEDEVGEDEVDTRQQDRSESDAETGGVDEADNSNGDGNGASNSHDNGEDDEGKPKKRRRRRRRGKSSKSREDGENGNGENGEDDADSGPGSDTGFDQSANAVTEDAPAEQGAVKKTRSRSRSRKPAHDAGDTAKTAEVENTGADTSTPEAEPAVEDAPKPKRTRKPRAKKSDSATAEGNGGTAPAPEAIVEDAPKPKAARKPRARKSVAAAEALVQPVAEIAPKAAAQPAPEPAAPKAEPAQPPAAPEPAVADDDASKPKRKGWWSLGR